jgi:hypothetical protein
VIAELGLSLSGYNLAIGWQQHLGSSPSGTYPEIPESR